MPVTFVEFLLVHWSYVLFHKSSVNLAFISHNMELDLGLSSLWEAVCCGFRVRKLL